MRQEDPESGIGEHIRLPNMFLQRVFAYQVGLDMYAT